MVGKTAPVLQIKGVSKRYNKQFVALDEVSLEVESGEFIVLVGKSGCGKSTLLRMIAGLTEPSAGQILLNGEPVNGPDRDRGMVFQSYTSLPWLTVLKNIAFGLELNGVSKRERLAIAQRFADMVGLTGFEHKYPRQLSGGMQQRVAIARTLANDPEIILMDEPFGALDSLTRYEMQTMLLDIWEKSKKTIIFITHDIEEAVFLADRIFVMGGKPGRILREIAVDLDRPRNADTIGSTKFIAYKQEILRLIHLQ